MEDSYFAYALLCFTSFFTLVNPFGTMPIFLTMTQSLGERERARILKKSAFVAFLILVSFTVFGQFIFKFFGLSTSGFRIVGGIIIFKIGYDMLQAKFTRVKVAEEEIKDYANDISVTPLAIPILCGPGAIANGIVLMEDAKDIFQIITLIAVIGIVFLLTYLTLRASSRLLKIIGETGNNVMMRLMGLILMVIAVECFFSGLSTIIGEML
ncbi:MAG: MarC family protein [Candidatus Limisoma sp.]